ncbi:hypothetical protein EB001_02665 [bacterium]|nr:hypothetical protein [bacterium]
MTNYNHYRTINDMTGLANKIGFEIGPSRGAFNSYAYETNNGTEFALMVPKDDGDVLPIYTRGVTIFSGSAEDCIHFMHGWNECRKYLNMLGFKDKTITDREEKFTTKRKMDRMTKAVVDGKDPGPDWHEGKEDEDIPF